MKFAKLRKPEIDEILNQKNLVVRNLQITLGYHRITRGLQKLMGERDVNWFAFGTYASKTAGQGLRHELLPKVLKSAMIRSAGYDNTYMYLDQVLNQPKSDQAENMLAEVLTKVSLLLSAGNLKIFQELAVPFSSLVYTFYRDWKKDEAKFQEFLAEHLNPAPIEEEGGQAYLVEAFTSFYNARFEINAKRKSELILLGNLLVGLHEQTLLQSIINKAIAVPFDVFTEGFLPEDNVPASTGKKMGKQAIGFSRKLVLRSITRMWMSYALPTRELKMGKDVVAPTGLINFPSELLILENPRCREIVALCDSNLNTLSGSAAGNWGSLEDRMDFLVDFFRSYQRYKPLFELPFHESQVPAILAGQIPAGPL